MARDHEGDTQLCPVTVNIARDVSGQRRDESGGQEGPENGVEVS